LQEAQRIVEILNLRESIAPAQQFSTARVADSRALPLNDSSIDGIVTSPPYCTRLDYGRATIAELLILEAIGLANYAAARSSLIGASITRGTELLKPRKEWGATCLNLLEKIYRHPSHASKSYYYKSHFAYFESMSASISEISRILRKAGRACVVVQDSYYKDLHTDLPAIITEMAESSGIKKVGEFRFEKRKSLCSINAGSGIYRAKRKPIETAILFERR
jgi:tRNA G10  N-methylase Trm11